jgi:hypothetical protein
MEKYCHEYKDSKPVGLTAENSVMKHKPYFGKVLAGTYCEWMFEVNSDKVHKIKIMRTNLKEQEIEIYLEGNKGESVTIPDAQVSRDSVTLDVYNALKIKVMTVQKLETASVNYE